MTAGGGDSIQPERLERYAARWHRWADDGILRVPPLALRAFGARLDRHDVRGERLHEALGDGDDLGDAVALWLKRGGPDGGQRWATFERALAHGIAAVPDAPGELKALFDSLERIPSWLDRELAAYGSQTLLRTGRRGTYALGAASLMSGYLSRGAVKPLAATGALTKNARRRLVETSKFVFDVASSKGMERFSDGFKTTVRVRVMHSMVRTALAPGYRVEEWGAPINQRDMVGTTLEFSVAFLGGLLLLGYLPSAREREAVVHLWRYVGVLLGTREELLPASFVEGLEVLHLFNRTEGGPDDDSRALAAALMDAWMHPEQPGLGIEGRFLRGYSRLVLGTKAADGLGLPRGPWTLAPLVLAPARAVSELLLRVIPGLRGWAVERGRRELERGLTRDLHGRAAEFRVT